MVAAADVGKLAAGLLQEKWEGHRVIELEGPTRVTPNQIATTLAKLLGKPVRMEVVPRKSWDALFRSQGMKNPVPRIRMLDGFNESWIEFERGKRWFAKGNYKPGGGAQIRDRGRVDQHVIAGDLASGSDIPLKRDAKIPRTRGVAGNNDRRYPK